MSYITAEKLANDIVEKRKKFLTDQIKRCPASNFRASNIGECDRQMVYSILDWEKSSLHDEGLQAIFNSGVDAERLVKRDLANLGFEVVAGQNDFEIKNRKGEVICRGHIDGKILYEDRAIPFEIKSMNMNRFAMIKDLESFQKTPLLRKYLRQMQMYLFGHNHEAGLFILTDMQGHYKILIVALDYGECEYILQRLERNWESVKKKEYPKQILYDDKICSNCSYKHICLPEVKNEGSQIIDNPELEESLERREELKKLVDEYDDLDTNIKKSFRGVSSAFIGTSWQIIGKGSASARVDIKALPEDIKKQYTVTTEKWTTKIVRLK